ncbi:MAG: hypothetical protein KHZ62_04500 [Clostridiales bacterium]|nr:hypothetical protein [Clostridiales bacterium]
MAKHIELEKKIQAMSSDYIYNEAVGNFLLLLMDRVEELKREIDYIPYELPKEISDIRNKINDFIINLEDILDADGIERTNALEQCLSLKKELVTIYGSVYRYFASWNVASALINDEVAKRRYKESYTDKKAIEFGLFYQDCAQFIHSANDPMEQKRYLGQLLKCIPLKMTREKFFDVVKHSLFLAFAGQSEASIDHSLAAFESTCAPENTDSYGQFFPEIAQWLKENKAITPAILSDSELDEVYEEFNDVFDTLDHIESYFKDLFHDINSLMILFYLRFSFDDITERDVAYADYYYTVRDILTGEEDTTVLETLSAQLERAFEPIIDKANSINKKETRLLEQLDFDNLEEDTAKVLSAEGFIRSCYYAELDSELFDFQPDSDAPEASLEFKNQKFDMFLSHMRQYYDNLPNNIRKSAMQILLSSLPPALSVEEVMDMLKDAVENCPTFEGKVLIVDKVGVVFSDNGFGTMAEEEEKEEYSYETEEPLSVEDEIAKEFDFLKDDIFVDDDF